MNYNYIFGFILLFTVAFLFGCDDDDGPTGPEGEGSFTVTISGDISRQFSGSAVFATNKEQGEEGFALALAAGDDSDETLMMVSFFLETGTPPGKVHTLSVNLLRKPSFIPGIMQPANIMRCFLLNPVP